jgi:predicted O-methyltransferase YrrM
MWRRGNDRRTISNGANRSRAFRERAHERFWWHKLPDTDYVPSIYATLTDDEWAILEAWYEETERTNHIGEINVPAMCLLQGFISGCGVRRVVQLGHYYGYSTLLLGFMLRAMGARPGLFSVDVSVEATAFTERWVERAGLGEYVSVFVGDSASEQSLRAAEIALGGPVQLVLVDSSHEYRHTLRELDGWIPKMPVGALMILHDTSRFAQGWDGSGQGGVSRALTEWLTAHPAVSGININGFAEAGARGDALVYKDGCGIGVLQKVGGCDLQGVPSDP